MRFLILKGLREFWEIATVLKLAVVAISKQYCLTLSRAKGSCIAWASWKTVAPKLSAAFPPTGGFGYFLCIKTKKVTDLGGL